jgi:glutamine kinase
MRVPQVIFGTKAETLQRLAQRLKRASVLPVYKVSVADWQRDFNAVIEAFKLVGWPNQSLIVRSSALIEDSKESSQAGRYISIPDVRDEEALIQAIDDVIASYDDRDCHNQVLIQPWLGDVVYCGVAFSRDPATAAPYYVISYSLSEGATDTVTSGKKDDVKTFYVSWGNAVVHEHPVPSVMDLLKEVENLVASDCIDIEFAFDKAQRLYLFQARPLICNKLPKALPENLHRQTLARIASQIEPGAIYGVMPDWNPAEIIGVRPRPLSLSLYRHLITDVIWAKARTRYGYEPCICTPIVVDFEGLPYIDVKASISSFFPRGLNRSITRPLLDYYLSRLKNHPELHDKIEFEIVFSCYTPQTYARLTSAKDMPLSERQITILAERLKALTAFIMDGRSTWLPDIARALKIPAIRKHIHESQLEPIEKVRILLSQCRKYGTEPFAGLARAAFIATEWLNSLVDSGIFDVTDRDHFLSSLNTVGQRILHDQANMPRAVFLGNYGHLRPGTYDILSSRYDECPDLYFTQAPDAAAIRQRQEFRLKAAQVRAIDRLLAQHGFAFDARALMKFLRTAIYWREESKFLFTQLLSDALVALEALGSRHCLSREDMSFLDINAVLSPDRVSLPERMRKSIDAGKQRFRLSEGIILPPLITSPEDVLSFEWPHTQPNFITRKAATGVTAPARPDMNLEGAIAAMPSADPGYDWIFSRGIAGFFTAYGGVNSHMAIRAAELEIPAIIGAGEALYAKWSQANVVHIDCSNRQVRIVC